MLGKQEFSLLEKRSHLGWVGAVCVTEESFRTECSVYQTRDVSGIRGMGGAHSYLIHGDLLFIHSIRIHRIRLYLIHAEGILAGNPRWSPPQSNHVWHSCTTIRINPNSEP